MDFMSGMLAATKLSEAIGKLIYNYLYGWVSGWSDSWSIMGAFSVTVIMFTLFLKVAVSPLDIWQKHLTRKNAKIMEKMKPALDKVTKQCGANKELLMQKQRAVYKEYKYSMFSSCLPMILTLVIFFIVFGGFNSAVSMHNKKIYTDMKEVYYSTSKGVYDQYAADGIIELKTDENGAKNYAVTEAYKATYTMSSVNSAAKEKAEQAVLKNYKSEKFFLTKNIFVPDTWKKPVPSAADFTGTGLGKSGITDVDVSEYNEVMSVLMKEYNGGWNGYLILPILAFAINLLSMKLNKAPQQPGMAGQTEEQQKAQQTQSKMMEWMMPVMMLIFAVFYSSAFTLYMLINSALTTALNLTYNIITKKIDAKEKDRIMSTTVKK